jgi:uncharacterized protein YlaI
MDVASERDRRRAVIVCDAIAAMDRHAAEVSAQLRTESLRFGAIEHLVALGFACGLRAGRCRHRFALATEQRLDRGP